MHSQTHYCQLAVWITITTLWQSAFAESIHWRANIDSAMREAQQDNKLVLIHFWDDHCPPCLRLEKNVFNQKDFSETIKEHYIPVKINISDAPQLRRQYRIKRWPTDIILNSRQQQVHRGVSNQSANEFTALLNQLASQARPEKSIPAADHGPVLNAPGVGATVTSIDDDRKSMFQSAGPVDGSFSIEDSKTEVPRNQLTPPTIPGSELTVPDRRFVRQSLSDEPRSAPPSNSHEPITAQTHDTLAGAATGEAQPMRPPPLALDGYCPVTLAGNIDKFPQWQPGNPQWGALHRGKLYLFVGPNEQREFLNNPDRYSPMLAGRDVVRLLKHGQRVAGARQHGVTYRNRIYLFTDEHSLQEFRKAPNYYAREAVKRTAVRR